MTLCRELREGESVTVPVSGPTVRLRYRFVRRGVIRLYVEDEPAGVLESGRDSDESARLED